MNPMDGVSSCSSSTGIGDGSSTNSSTINIKQSNINNDITTLPPSKRRLRDKTPGISNTSIPSSTMDTSNNSTSITNNSSNISMTKRETPINSIKQFLEIRKQVRNFGFNEFVCCFFPFFLLINSKDIES